MRNDFPKQTKEILAKRVGMRCSNPTCRKPTTGPTSNPGKVVNVGVAAHITAASPGGSRFCQSLTPEQRSGIANGIWLCQTCAKLIDSDEELFPASLLIQWKTIAEQEALLGIKGHGLPTYPDKAANPRPAAAKVGTSGSEKCQPVVVVGLEAMEAIFYHAAGFTHEVGGVLIGASSPDEVTIRRVINTFGVRYGEIRLAEGEHIVGFWHSHVGVGPFLSGPDQAHLEAFPDLISLVIDAHCQGDNLAAFRLVGTAVEKLEIVQKGL